MIYVLLGIIIALLLNIIWLMLKALNFTKPKTPIQGAIYDIERQQRAMQMQETYGKRALPSIPIHLINQEENTMRLYEVIKGTLANDPVDGGKTLLEDIKGEFLWATGETYASAEACKKHIKDNHEPYMGRSWILEGGTKEPKPFFVREKIQCEIEGI